MGFYFIKTIYKDSTRQIEKIIELKLSRILIECILMTFQYRLFILNYFGLDGNCEFLLSLTYEQDGNGEKLEQWI